MNIPTPSAVRASQLNYEFNAPEPKPLPVEPTPYTPSTTTARPVYRKVSRKICRKQIAWSLEESMAQYASKTAKYGWSDPVRYYDDCTQHPGVTHYTRDM